ncbi:Crp/Fnr family transcriptional regulator [Mycobacterium sherrisii]|uniref:Crp/Fnr family transcriptional regulator n=1 Tax=Mycobacterium sherrisii TaxID=243061 RepID=UPI000A04B96F|nr:Crp/Fnr family transcriptional regulator [Mycobacterium sherrisii]MCV7028006.1 Crp/Fnr family transcriptional regulator [Mycobacterium sherrisii]MEC4765104.1 Crp/Fnr family transcriptional regulator [Mycobacterium sherrisii]ORW84557.1 hypothetical protein AWC25_23955 [Mycobacterium sherrisii]
MASPTAVALTPVLLVVALLWWETTGSDGLTFDKRPRSDTAPLATPSTVPAPPSKYTDVHRALIGCGIFSRTRPEIVAALSEALVPERFGPGRVLGARSVVGECLYLVVSGKVKVSYQRYADREIVLMLLGPSEIFGTVTLFDAGPQDMTMTALTDVVAVSITRDRLSKWMRQCPEVCEQVLRLFARWVKAMTNSLSDLVFADEQGRVASRLLLLKQRFGHQDGEVVRVEHGLSIEDFAHLAGVDPERVAATLRGFEANGWIRLERRGIVIVDGQALSQLRQLSTGRVTDV